MSKALSRMGRIAVIGDATATYRSTIQGGHSVMPLSRVGNAESSAAAHLLTRIGRDSVHKYPVTAAALSPLPAKQAYLDGELCGVTRDGKTSFSLIQTASDSGNATRMS
jgi:hypothetical protein